MSEISEFQGLCTPAAQAARHKWAIRTHPYHSRVEDTKTWLPVHQVLAEALLLKDELLGRIAGLDAKIEELRDMQ